MKKKLLFVFGTRPEALKLAPVILKAKEDKRFQTFVCLTAQHRQMVDQVMRLFNLKPDFDLNIMRPGQTLGELTHRLFDKIQPIFDQVQPDWVLTQGDTTTAFAVALKAFYEKIKVAHVEAGLRSFNKHHPFPEEINRIMISHLADLHFPPTKESAKNLCNEGILKKQISITGNTVVDALKIIRKQVRSTDLPTELQSITGRRIVFVTAHRRENFGAPLVSICNAFKDIVKKYPDVLIVYPVHLNPQVQRVVRRHLQKQKSIILLPPLSYVECVAVMEKSHLILTDSGGIQEEAPSFRKPVLVLREVTERPDGVRLGVAKLVGTSRKRIFAETSRLLTSPKAYCDMIRSVNPYGDGNASQRILNKIAKFSAV